MEPRTKVSGEDVQQTTLEGGGGEELELLHADGHPTLTPCTTIGGYTLPCHETPTPMEVCESRYQQECIQSLGEEDEGNVDHGRDEYEEMIGRDDFHEYVDHYENADKFIMMLWMIKMMMLWSFMMYRRSDRCATCCE